MRILLDTHAILWMIADDRRLSREARRHIESAEDLAWSTASLWEIGIKLSLQRPDFALGDGWEHSIPAEMTRNGIRRIDLQPHHCAVVSSFPWHHRDPFDRMLAAQAHAENRHLLSCDEIFDAYPITRIW
jgi:PIN domain nuclease of toxin-antitoxin system